MALTVSHTTTTAQANDANYDISADAWNGTGAHTISIATALSPDANDGASLGVSGTAWSDLFLATGGVLNWGAGNVTLTHSAGKLATNATTLSLPTSGAVTWASDAISLKNNSTNNLTLTGVKTVTITGDAATALGSILSITQELNNAAVDFECIKFAVTDTASTVNTSYFNITQTYGGLGVTAFNMWSDYALEIKGMSLASGKSSGTPRLLVSILGESFARIRLGLNSSNVPSLRFGPGTATADCFLTRSAAATLQLGDSDAAAPVAQILQAQSVVAGTSNTAGTDLTIIGSKSTGNAAGGKITFKQAPAGGAGSTQNSATTIFTLPQDNGTSGYLLKTDGTGVTSWVAANGTITFVIDGGGSAITTGNKGYLEVPFACTITQVTTLADQSGSIVVDIWKDTYANYPPTVADTITASAKPTLSSATKAQDSTLTGWTTTIAAGDILGFNVDSVATVTRVVVSLKIRRT